MLRSKIQAAVAEWLSFVKQTMGMKKHKEDLLTFDFMVKPIVAEYKNAMTQLSIPEKTFQEIRKQITELAGWMKPSKHSNTYEFLSGLRQIFKHFGVTEQDYWTDVTIRRYNQPIFAIGVVQE